MKYEEIETGSRVNIRFGNYYGNYEAAGQVIYKERPDRGVPSPNYNDDAYYCIAVILDKEKPLGYESTSLNEVNKAKLKQAIVPIGTILEAGAKDLFVWLQVRNIISLEEPRLPKKRLRLRNLL